MSASPAHVLAAGKCNLADNIPKVKPTGNIAMDHRLTMDRQHLVDCVNMLWSNSWIRGDCSTYLRQQLDLGKAKATAGPDSFEDISTFGRIDETFMASWCAKQLDVDVGAFGKAKLFDDRVVRQVAQALTNIGPGTQVPALSRNRAVMTMCLDSRALLGSRAKKFIAAGNIIDQNGQMNWLNGVYGIVFDDDQIATHVVHRASGEKVPIVTEVPIDNNFSLSQGWDEQNAKLEKGKTVYKLKEQFGKKVGPNAGSTWGGKCTAFEEVAKEADAQLKFATKSKSAEALNQAAIDFVTPLKERKAEQTRKAREALTERKEVFAKKRRVSLSTAAPNRSSGGSTEA